MSVEIMKALVVRISSVIDSQKGALFSSKLGETIDTITDLIRVVYNFLIRYHHNMF